MSRDPKAAGLAVNWQCFGSNDQDKADYSRGVLERFTRRAPKDWAPDGKGNAHVKTIANPRNINIYGQFHYPAYWVDRYSINENGGMVRGPFNHPVTAEKIVIHHYNTKSREEHFIRRSYKRKDVLQSLFEQYNRNEFFDDSILKYRDARKENFALESDDDRLIRVKKALTETLPTVDDVETALTCRALSSYLQEKFPDDAHWRRCEEESLGAVVKLLDKMNMTETQFLLRELLKLWFLPYPVVNELRGEFIQRIPEILENLCLRRMWVEYFNLDSLQYLLKPAVKELHGELIQQIPKVLDNMRLKKMCLEYAE